MYSLVPPRSALIVIALLFLAVGALAGEGCKYVARHVRIGWQP